MSWVRPLPAELTGAGARRRTRTAQGTPYLYLVPAFALYLGFFCWPLVRLIQYSLQSWDGTSKARFVGLDNYRELAHDPLFWQAFRHNFVWMLAAILVPTLVGLALATVLVRSQLYARAWFRAVYFLPQVLASVVVAITWQWVYSPSFGALNAILRDVGLASAQQGWLGETTYALPAVFLVWAWTAYGFSMVIFVAALQGIDEEYFEASRVDGAHRWAQFRHVLLPFIRRPTSVIVLMNAIAAFQVFDLVFVMTGGGPANATLVLSIYVYDNAFQALRVGYGSAVAVILGLVIVVSSVVFLRIRGVLGANA